MTRAQDAGTGSRTRLLVPLAMLLVAIGLVVALVVSRSGSQNPFANYVTKVDGITPALPGVTATAPYDGADITVTNTTDTVLVIDGYQGEPYLEITKSGVRENQMSPATYLNKEAFINSIPTTVNAGDTPVWKSLGSADNAQWHDHRIHWMGATVPPVVQKDPHSPHLITQWSIPMRYGDTTATITGTLSYKPTSRVGTYLSIGLGGLVLLAILGGTALMLWDRRRRDTRPTDT